MPVTWSVHRSDGARRARAGQPRVASDAGAQMRVGSAPVRNPSPDEALGPAGPSACPAALIAGFGYGKTDSSLAGRESPGIERSAKQPWATGVRVRAVLDGRGCRVRPQWSLTKRRAWLRRYRIRPLAIGSRPLHMVCNDGSCGCRAATSGPAEGASWPPRSGRAENGAMPLEMDGCIMVPSPCPSGKTIDVIASQAKARPKLNAIAKRCLTIDIRLWRDRKFVRMKSWLPIVSAVGRS